jgi:hypothetical protein
MSVSSVKSRCIIVLMADIIKIEIITSGIPVISITPSTPFFNLLLVMFDKLNSMVPFISVNGRYGTGYLIRDWQLSIVILGKEVAPSFNTEVSEFFVINFELHLFDAH